MEMDEAKMLAVHERITVRLKKRAVKDARGPQDVNPSLFVTLTDGTHHAGAPIAWKMGPEFDLGRALATDVFLLWCEKSVPIERIIVCMDAYVQLVEDRDEAAVIERGDLRKDFRNNPNSKVQEGCVTAFIWHNDGRYYGAMCTQGYTWAEGGVMAWGEAKVSDVVDLTVEGNSFGAVMESALAVMQVTREETDE